MWVFHKLYRQWSSLGNRVPINFLSQYLPLAYTHLWDFIVTTVIDIRTSNVLFSWRFILHEGIDLEGNSTLFLQIKINLRSIKTKRIETVILLAFFGLFFVVVTTLPPPPKCVSVFFCVFPVLAEVSWCTEMEHSVSCLFKTMLCGNCILLYLL